jgi:hypothetical protein
MWILQAKHFWNVPQGVSSLPHLLTETRPRCKLPERHMTSSVPRISLKYLNILLYVWVPIPIPNSASLNFYKYKIEVKTCRPFVSFRFSLETETKRSGDSGNGNETLSFAWKRKRNWNGNETETVFLGTKFKNSGSEHILCEVIHFSEVESYKSWRHFHIGTICRTIKFGFADSFSNYIKIKTEKLQF